MVQAPFVQVMAVAGFLALVTVIAAMPIGFRWGFATGRFVLHASLIGVVLVMGVCLAYGMATGNLASFNLHMGAGVWLEMGGFFSVWYWLGYRFASGYLAWREKEQEEEAEATNA